MYSAIICGLYTKRNSRSRRLPILLIVTCGTFILGRILYMLVVMLLYSILCTRALIGGLGITKKEIRLIKLAAVLGGLI